ncbi:MAG: hypothetical protein ACC707_00445 [Thiohalomonadales bacterium]
MSKIIGFIIVLAILATVAYQMGWLSYKGESVYEEVEGAVKDSINQ